jgi:TM2 domain-containing membrane protein YozV
MPDSTAFCMSCGAARSANAHSARVDPLFPAAAKSKMTAGILGILFGGLGIHRFYLGYTTIGIIQVVLTICTLGIAALWGFVEGILILAGQINTDAAGQPLANY